MNELKILKILAIMENFRLKEEKSGKDSTNDKDFCLRVYEAIIAEHLLNCSDRFEWIDKLKNADLVSYKTEKTQEDYNENYKKLTEELRNTTTA